MDQKCYFDFVNALGVTAKDQSHLADERFLPQLRSKRVERVDLDELEVHGQQVIAVCVGLLAE